MATARDFHRSRREIGLAVSDTPRTQYEIGKTLGRSSGSISRPLHSMLSDGLLLADPDPPVRGTLYRLNPEARDALEEAAAGALQPGVLVRDQRLLFVQGGEDRMQAMALLAKPSLSGAVAWAARTDASTGLLLAMNPDADDLQVDKLIVALKARGFELREGVTGQITSASELRAHGKALDAVLDQVE